ncbi:phosphatase PAP2 family protein [Geodermatophilus nigrescens]|uniref:Undecaprenyl-diphosphatase n=1 Tax=Geodermatophilus nigrescens TaxID=1070870 RepID=A0A1M5D837_9ACTN|nr:phosphatase PAP2 family protein [Geodermatophilus nigrescens]SHF62832.1 undecaprenyl-diphosphatase [Geodermatophilus nigrescens]
MTPLRLRYWDARLHAAVGALPESPADRWLRRLTRSADHGRLWFAVALLLALRRGPSRRAALRGLGSLTVASTVVNTVLKRVFGRVRPDMANLSAGRALPRAPHTFSFPSGHSASAGAFATGVVLESPMAGAAVGPLALAVGYSRVHVGVHYPGDVVSGLAIGAGLALAGRRLRPPPTPPAAAPEAPALPRGGGLVVVATPAAAADVRRLLPDAEVLDRGPDALRDAARGGRARALGVAGDEDAVAAAAAVAAEHGLPLAVFGGTGPLGGAPEGTAAAVAAGSAAAVDVAEVDGALVTGPAVVGLRLPPGSRAAARALRDATPVGVVVDGRPAEVWALSVAPGRSGGPLDVRCVRADVPFARLRAVLAPGGRPVLAGREVRVHLWSGPRPVHLGGRAREAATAFTVRARPPLVVYRPR